MLDVVDEFRRRDPEFIAKYPVRVTSVQRLADRYRAFPPIADIERGVLEAALTKGLQDAAEGGLQLDLNAAEADPLGNLLADSIVDAYAGETGRLGLRAAPRPHRPIVDDLAERFDVRHLPDGLKYLTSKRGNLPLVVVNACGLPLGSWHRLIIDNEHDLRLMLVESRDFDLVAGGMCGTRGLEADATDVISMLDQEGIAQASVMSWCSGARVAAELAAKYPGRVRSLIFVSPTFRGTSGFKTMPSPFEDNLAKIFATVIARPKLADYLTEAIREFDRPVVWDELAADVAVRAARFSGLPAKENAAALLTPMNSPPHLSHYAVRMLQDMARHSAETFERITAPILLVTGDSDDIVNNNFSRSVLKRCKGELLEAKVSGAGHYIQDLQYRYLKFLATTYLLDSTSLTDMARVKIERNAPI